jgi:uncharacterized protein (DUF58 family)
MPAITRSARYYLVAFGVAFFLGLIFGNFAYLLGGLLLLGVLVVGIRSGLPSGVTITRTLSAGRVTAGSTVDVHVEVTITSGRGLLQVHDRLPDAFSLTKGNNTHLIHKGPEPKTFSYEYSFRCSRRGGYELPGTQAIALHTLSFVEALQVAQGPPAELTVDPRTLKVRRVRNLRGKASTVFPAGDVAKSGIRTTDFMELRDYERGDPLKNVNWRSTAKHSIGDELHLMVNEYDVEGKKSVWFLIDSAQHMEVGSTLENTFDATIEATLELLEHFSDNGYRVGGSVYNTTGDPHSAPLFHTDYGRAHFLKIARTLSGLATVPAHEPLDHAVQRSRGFLTREKPLIVLVTRPEADYEGTVRGIKRLLTTISTGKRTPPILLIAPRVHSTVKDSQRVSDLALATVDHEVRLKHKALRRMGVVLLDWDPKQGPIGALMMRGVKKR